LKAIDSEPLLDYELASKKEIGVPVEKKESFVNER